MKIGARLAFGFALVLALSVTMTAIGMWFLQGVGTSTDDMIERARMSKLSQEWLATASVDMPSNTASYTLGIPKGTQVNAAQARALVRLGAAEAMLFGSTVIGHNLVHADTITEARVELGIRLCPGWRIHDVDFSSVANGTWRHDAGIDSRTLESALNLYERWKGHPRVQVNLAAHAVDTYSEGLRSLKLPKRTTWWSPRTLDRAKWRPSGYKHGPAKHPLRRWKRRGCSR